MVLKGGGGGVRTAAETESWQGGMVLAGAVS
jgi:hypothetical protein